MNTIINRFNELNRNTRIAIIIALCVFTPAVSIGFTVLFNGIGAAFSIIGIALGLLNWKGVLFMVMVCGAFIAKALYTWAMEEEEEDTQQEDDIFNW
jgi:sugar phosphate permease